MMKPPRYACSSLYGVEDCTSRKQAEAKSISNYRKWRNAGRWRQLSFATFGYPTEKPIPFIFRASLMKNHPLYLPKICAVLVSGLSLKAGLYN